MLNIDKVKVHWIFGTSQAPLIIVIVISLLVGDRAHLPGRTPQLSTALSGASGVTRTCQCARDFSARIATPIAIPTLPSNASSSSGVEPARTPASSLSAIRVATLAHTAALTAVV